ncbi:hypothetical protein CPC16_005677 [Podila verticillata]|nr:hypothetical protein CPC16_005677 [Podila verticillata]
MDSADDVLIDIIVRELDENDANLQECKDKAESYTSQYFKSESIGVFFMLDPSQCNDFHCPCSIFNSGIPRIKQSDYPYMVAPNEDLIGSKHLHLIKEELADYRDLVENIVNIRFERMANFLRFVASRDYSRTKLLAALSHINDNDAAIQKEKENVLQEIIRLDKLVPQADDQERMFKLTIDVYGRFRRPPNVLFLVLPTSLGQWDPASTINPTFRLYFLCKGTDVKNKDIEAHILYAEHAHISNHAGYVLKNPQDFLQNYGDHALAVLLMVKYGFFGSDYRIPSLHSFKVLAAVEGTTTHHKLTSDNIGPLIDEAIAYIRAFPQLIQSGQPVVDPWGIKSFLQLDDSDSGTGDLCFQQSAGKNETLWLCTDHSPLDPGAKTLKEFVQSRDGTIDLHNYTIRITLTSASEADRFATCNKSKVQYFEVFLHIAWSVTRCELQGVCEQLVNAGFLLLRVHGVPSCVASLGPVVLNRNTTSLIILCNYPRPAESYVFITMDDQFTKREYVEQGKASERKDPLCRHYGLHFQRLVDETDILFGDLVHCLSDEIEICEKGMVLFKQRERPPQHMTFGLSGVSVFSRRSLDWQGQLGVTDGIIYGLAEAVIPNTNFSTMILECGKLRRLVLQSYYADDMLQVMSLMECSPLLQTIEVPAQENNIFARIASIRQGRHNLTHPVEVSFLHRQQERVGVLAKVVIGGIEHSETLEASPQQNNPAVTILDWHLDQVSGQIQNDSLQVLDSASRLFPSALTSFTVDITSLQSQGLVHICNVLQQSALENLHVRCVPFMPFLEVSITQIFQAIQWPTIKSLVLTGNNIDDWLALWGCSDGGLHNLVGAWIDTSASGPSLASLSIIAHEESQAKLSHASTLAIHHLVYSCRLVELRLENVLLEKKQEWDLILKGIHYSSLRSVSLQGSNLSNFQRRRVVRGRSLLRIKERVGGWLRKKL